MTPEIRSDYAKSTPSFEGSVDWNRVRMDIRGAVDPNRPEITAKEAKKTNIKQALENLSKSKPEDQQKGARQLAILGQQADNIGLVPQASEYVRNMVEVFGDDALQRFQEEPERFEQFEQITRQLNKNYGKSGNMHIDGKNGMASMILENEVRAMAYERAKASGANVEWAAPKRWYPEEGTFTYYQDFSFNNDPKIEPDFMSQIPAVGSLAATRPVPPFTPDTQSNQPVTPDSSPGKTEFSDPWIKTQFQFLKNATIARPFEAAYEQLGARLESLDPKEAQAFQQFLEREINRLSSLQRTSSPNSNASGMVDSETLGKELSKALFGDRLTKDEKLIELLDAEQWNEGELPPFNPESPPNYYIDMTSKERDELKYRTILARVAHYKRNSGPPGLDTLNKYPEWGKFGKEQTQALYEIPGVRQAMEQYVQMFTNDEQIPGVQFSLRKAKDRNSQLMVYRKYIRSKISGDVARGWRERFEDLSATEQRKYVARGFDRLDVDDPQAKVALAIKSREAEQIAFNLLYSGNFFEANDSVWDRNGVRLRRPETSSDLLNPVLMEQMKPLDSLVGSFVKDPNSVGYVGKFGEWAYRQMIKSNGGKKLVNVDRVRIVDDNNGGNFWTKDGDTILVPEAYPRVMVGSFWDETSVRVKERGQDVEHSLTDLLNRGVAIPWGTLESQGIWQSYSSKMGKAAKLWEVFQGKASLKSDTRSMEEWKTDVDGALGKFEKRNETSVKRWLIYASVGVDIDSRKPKLSLSSMRLPILSSLGPKALDYSSWDDLLFPWDRY
jgi:hypothetical protein